MAAKKKVAKVLVRKEPPPVVDKAAEKRAALALAVNTLKMQIDNGHKVRSEQLDELLALANS